MIDLEALSAWMDEQGLPEGRIEDVTQLAGGTQNLLLSFTRNGERYVFRHPPEHKRENSDETMRREARVLEALAGTDVPHPRLIAACADESILGSAFYLMEEVDGTNPTVGLPATYAESQEWRHRFGLDMADAIAAVGAVDYRARGLTDLGRPAGYLERQVDRWRAQLDSYRKIPGYDGPEIPSVDEVASWLNANRPESWEPGLIHGDYHLANVMCDPDRPRVAAVIDWELTTIGDPLLDLGWLLATWPEPEHDETILVTPWDGFPSAGELVARYSERSSRDLSAISWYEVLACYKLGIILEGTHARAMSGAADRSTGDLLHQKTLSLFQRGLRRIAAI